MPRRRRLTRRLGCLSLALALLTACGSGNPSGPAPGELPNILWLTAEDMSANVGAYGDAYAETPNIDSLAERGVRYTNAFATAPVCSPARFALITGMYATSAGTMGLRASAAIPDYVTGFPSLLRGLGYYTTNNVKTDYNTADEQRLIAESWNESSATAHWRGRETEQPFFAVFNHMHTHQSRISFLDTEFEELEGFLGRHDPASAPLPPYYPDEPEVRQTVARYYDAIAAMDASVGRLLAQLDEDGLADDTIVFFYGDHGVGLPRGKRLPYDSGLRVALVVYYPPKWAHLSPGAPGSTADRLVSFVDFAPTILRTVGLEVPAYMQGRAFAGPQADPPRDFIVGARDRVDEAYDTARAVRDDEYLYVRHYRPELSWNQPEYFSDQAPIRQAITRRALEGTLDEAQMTYAGPVKPAEGLFAVAEDPHQIDNLAANANAQAALERMRARLRAWQLETRDLGFMPEGMALRLTRELGETPLEFADDEDVYPLERILGTVALIGRAETAAALVGRLGDPHGVVRYWASVGLDAAAPLPPGAAAALGLALNDAVPEVRIAAATALVRRDASSEALGVLADELESSEPQVVLMAARALQLLGTAADPVRGAMQDTLAKAQNESVYGPDALFIGFALTPALSNERAPTVVIEGPGRDMAPGGSSSGSP